jgi:hypothetical protein
LRARNCFQRNAVQLAFALLDDHKNGVSHQCLLSC